MKVLIIQIRQLGDVLLSTPMAEAVKNSRPDCKVHFLTSESAKDILMNNPYIDKVLVFENGLIGEFNTLNLIRKEKYDAVIDVQRTGRSKRLTLLSSAKARIAFKKGSENFYYNCPIDHSFHGYTAFERLDLLKGLGIAADKQYMPRLYFGSKDLFFIKEYLKKNEIGKFFIVAPAARKEVKMWSAEQFGKLADKIFHKTTMMPVLIYGTPQERKIAEKCTYSMEKYHIIEKPLSIKRFTALVSLSSLFIGNDSFPAHIAVSQKIKTVVVCGPTSGWFLSNEKTISVYKGLKCQPCNDYKSCRFDLLCYKSLNYLEVFEKISHFIS